MSAPVCRLRLSVTLSALLLFLVSGTLLHAQKTPPIEFSGAPAYSTADLLTVAGLSSTTPITTASIQQAAQRLADTGLFADVRYNFRPQAVAFTLKPAPATELIPARFVNFVWWTPAELLPLVEAKVPLFTGSVPENGNLQDAVKTALIALLAAKGVPAATLTVMPVTSPGKTDAIAYTIDSPAITIHTVTLSGVSASEAPHLALFLKSQANVPYDGVVTQTAIASGLRDLYGDNGYLDASLGPLVHSAPTVVNNAVALDLTGTVTEGAPYHLSALTWPGSDVYSTAEFAKNARLHPDDIASERLLRQTLRPLANAYYARGYQDVRVQAPAVKDPATHRVAYSVHVLPGDQYRLKTLTATGLSDQQRHDFDTAWHMHPGDFYDVTYVTGFLRNTGIKSLMGYSAKYRAVADPDTHLVDLTLTFGKGGTLEDIHQVENVTATP